MQLLFSGQCLFLSEDPESIRMQLAGKHSTLQEAGKLRDNISTDEITPVPIMSHYDDSLKFYPYIGLQVQGQYPIKEGDVGSANICVTVAGERYGKGSSREHSPVAEYAAGVRLVIAKSFEYIYRQNADNIGLLTSTDFSLVERIQRGEAISLEEVIADRDDLTQSIIKAGGLLKYGQQHLQNNVSDDRTLENQENDTPQTYAEKIFSRHAVSASLCDSSRSGQGSFVKADKRFIVEVYTGMAHHLLKKNIEGLAQLYDPKSIIAFEDHFAYKHRSKVHQEKNLIPGFVDLSNAHQAFVAEYGIQAHGLLLGEDGSEGICHSLMAERYALPGEVIAGTDSHTTHSGGLGCIAFGVGTTNLTNAMLTGKVRYNVPEILNINLTGILPAGITAKDIILRLLALPEIKAGAGIGKVFEFTGDVIRYLTTDERCTLTNMTTEMGGMCGLIIPDKETVRFIKERRGVDVVLESWMHCDHEATYTNTITLDCSDLTPMLASPGDPGNGMALETLPEKVPVDIAYAGSCTAGKREDFDYYHEVLSWALKQGLSVAPTVKLFLQFGSLDVRDYCIEKGYVNTFEQLDIEILQPQCGACCNCGPGSSESAEQVTVSSINRNFPGRSGPGKVWLASPPTVVASAIAGYITSFEALQRSRCNDRC